MTGYFLDALGPVNYWTTGEISDMEPQPFISINADAARLLTLLAGILAGGVVVTVFAVVVSILVTFRQWRRHRSLSHSPSLYWVAVIICLISLPACGLPQYLPIRIISYSVDGAGAVAVGTVKIWVRPGLEWLEVSVLNAGSNPVAIDWVHASFIEPSGKTHSLISASELGEIYSRIQVMYVTQRARANGNTEMFSAGQRTLVTDRLLDEVQTTRESLTLVTPGSRQEELFYPKDHVRLDWEGGWRATSLFCDRAMVAEWVRGESFELLIPLLIDGRWTNVRIVGRIER